MRRKTKVKAVVIVLGFVLLVTALGLVLHLLESGSDSKTGQAAEDNGTYIYLGDHEYEVTHNLENYLLIGSDDSGNEDRSKNEEYHGGMADFIMLLVLDKTDNTYGYLPIDRDTIVNVPVIDENGEESLDAKEQICCARWYGKDPEQGCENTVDCVSDLLGALEIDGYYSINMHDIGTLNHAVGGVTVTIEDDFTAKDHTMAPGATIKLDDRQAEIFLRGRMDVGDGKNSSRMRRQQAYMKGFSVAAKQKMKDDPDFANDLYKTMRERAVTNLPGNRVSKISNMLYKGRNLGVFNISGTEKEGKTLDDGLVHNEFYPDEESIIEAMIKLCSLKDKGTY